MVRMRKRAPALSLETVIDEVRAPLLLDGRRPERAYLVLEKHDQQVYLGTDSEDIEQRLESLMSSFWVPLGFVAYDTNSPKPVTRSLNWYSDLLRRDERRYSQVCNTVAARLEEAGRRLTNELSESRVIQRVQ
jgi:hypothetical protein